MTQANKLNCPNCKTKMDPVADPDMTYEKCPQCQGIFLDKGELNKVATGMAGEIEFCSIEKDAGDPDQFPTRYCPKCADQPMKKEDLLIYSDIIFDYCEKCAGWFLDYAELEKMNIWLAKLRKSQGGSEEYREEHRDHLVIISKLTDVHIKYSMGFAIPSAPIITEMTRIEVYYKKALLKGLRLSPETLIMNIWKLFGTQDIKTGDSAFDKAFIIQGNKPQDVIKTLSEDVRKSLLDFYRSSLYKTGWKRVFEVLDNRIVYSYLGDTDEKQRTKLVEALVDIADKIKA